MNTKTTLFGLVLLGLICGVLSHSYITSPTSRSDQKNSVKGCRGPNCLGPCDVPVSEIKSSRASTAARGDSITIKWPRNNHAGGFIRFAWAPTDQSDNHAAFDNNVQQINCHEVGGCGPDDTSKPNSGDTAPADGSSRACTISMRVPLDLTDGKWTLQWAWFGGENNLGDYYSCVDYKISGGDTGSSTPIFVGGDFSNPGVQKCKFFNTDRLHRCINEPCSNPVYNDGSKEHNGLPAYIQEGSTPVPQTTTGVKPATTTGKPATTTGKPATTTGKPVTTTGKPVTTTGKPVTTTGKPATTGKPVNSNNCTANADFTGCSGTAATQRCYLGRLYEPVNCPSGLVCKYSPSTVDKLGNQNGYCMRTTDIPRDNETSGSTQLFNSLWISMTLVAVCYLL